jgi:hypothetical protein
MPIQFTRHSRERVIHGIGSLPAGSVRLVSSNLQPPIPDSAPGRHNTRQRLVNSPAHGTHRSRNRTERPFVRIVRLVRVFSGGPLSRIPRLSRIFSGQAFHTSAAALSTPPGRTGGTLSSFSALFWAQTPLREGSARTSLDSAKNKPDLSTFRKQKASLTADLVRLVRLISPNLQRAIPDSASVCYPQRVFHASPAALSTQPKRTAMTSSASSAFSSFSPLLFAAIPPSARPAGTTLGSARTSLDSAKNSPDLNTFRKQKATCGCRGSRISRAACRKPANR